MSPQLGLAGWFGKIPAVGDFVGRRLPPSFIDRWDAWLALELSALRTESGADWGPLWASAATVCFTLGAGLVDEFAWHGILMPSSDRIGRQFPLTIVGRGAQSINDAGQTPYWAALNDTAAQTRDAACTVDSFDRALLAMQVPTCTQNLPGLSVWGCWMPAARLIKPLLSLPGLPQGANFRRLLRASEDDSG